MNAITSPSFPRGLPEIGSESDARASRNLSMLSTIKRGADRAVAARGMSDEQRDAEWALQKRLREALGELRGAIDAVNDGSVVVNVSLNAFLAFVHDEMPDEANWDEKISEARNG